MKNSIEHEELLSKRTVYKEQPGVYFLFKDEEIVYIGQAVDLPSRINQHNRTKTQNFDTYTFVECDKSELDYLESTYILKYEPVGNKLLPVTDFYKRAGLIYNSLGINVHQFRRLIEKHDIKPVGKLKYEYYDTRDFEQFRSEEGVVS